jgi:hypothetical protein
MRKLSVGLLAAVVIALASAPADAAKKKKAGKSKKGKAEVAQTYSGPTPLGDFSCWLTGATATKSPGPACGR